jgi:small subunit ribosomal protein S4e
MHTKRIAIGYGKENKWVSTPNPGAHTRKESIPLILVVRDILGFADTSREAKKIIHDGLVSVDKKVRRDHKYGVGLMDVIEIPTISKHYRMVPGKKGLEMKEIDEKESSIKPCRVIGKTVVKGGKIQLVLHDGGALLADKDDYKTNDTIVIKLPERKMSEAIRFEKGNLALIYKGRHKGMSGKIKDIILATATRKSVTTLDDMQTLTEYSFIIGSDKPVIKI